MTEKKNGNGKVIPFLARTGAKFPAPVFQTAARIKGLAEHIAEFARIRGVAIERLSIVFLYSDKGNTHPYLVEANIKHGDRKWDLQIPMPLHDAEGPDVA